MTLSQCCISLLPTCTVFSGSQWWPSTNSCHHWHVMTVHKARNTTRFGVVVLIESPLTVVKCWTSFLCGRHDAQPSRMWNERKKQPLLMPPSMNRSNNTTSTTNKDNVKQTITTCSLMKHLQKDSPNKRPTNEFSHTPPIGPKTTKPNNKTMNTTKCDKRWLHG